MPTPSGSPATDPRAALLAALLAVAHKIVTAPPAPPQKVGQNAR